MESKQLFRKYYSRLMWEGILKSFVCGLIVAFAANFVAALVTWFIPMNGLSEVAHTWASIGISLGAALLGLAVSMPIFYFKVFRPTTKRIAERIDRLGLEERLITMYELEQDESYIALRQREDAKQHLASFSEKNLRFHVSRATIIAAAVLAVFGLSMTTVTGLSAMGVLAGGDDLLPGEIPLDEIACEVTYMVEGGGTIQGEADQVVMYGEDASTVVAVADDGYVFSGWDDGLQDPSRTDTVITENLVFIAKFEEVGEGEGQGQGQGEGEGDEGEEGDQGDQPGDQPGNSEGNPQGEGNSAGGKYEESNQIVDGNTYYRDLLDADTLNQLLEDLAGDDSLTAEERAVIESYFNSIK